MRKLIGKMIMPSRRWRTLFSAAPSYLPNSLRLLDWKGYPSKSFPDDFIPQRIVDFKLPHSPLMLEKPFQVHTFAN
jgi:hypothetical protein